MTSWSLAATPESSAALAANAFGFFLNRASDLPALPGCESESWPARSLALEAEIRFPWRGWRHPVLDCLVETPSALIGIESKRFYYGTQRRPSATPVPLTWASVPEDYDVQIKGLRRHLDISQAGFARMVGAAGKAVVYQ